MEEIDVPHFFICPISLQMMTDPVTLSSGITFDRQSIEKWLFSGKNTTCPVTKLPVSDTDLTPNHTLRRLIQSWCTLNAHHGIDRIPTPKPPVTNSVVSKLIAAGSPSLRRLKSIAAENESNKRVIEAAGGVNFLASTIIQHDYTNNNKSSSSSDNFVNDAMFLLHTLQLSESGLKTLLSAEKDGSNFIDALSKVMQKGSYESRVYAVFILKSMVEIADPVLLSGMKRDLFFQLIQLLKDQISRKASKACLQVLTTALRWGRNKVKAAETGAVTALVELLLSETTADKRMCELMLTAMEMVCRCAEGRAELVGHAAGLAVVSKKILRVSMAATDRGVRIMNWVSKYSATPAVLQEMLQVGAVAKLCYVVELERWGIGNGIKEKAGEVIKLHARTWRASPCVPHTHLLFS